MIPSTLEVVFEYWEQEDVWIPIAFITSKLDKFRYLRQQESMPNGPRTQVVEFKQCNKDQPDGKSNKLPQ